MRSVEVNHLGNRAGWRMNLGGGGQLTIISIGYYEEYMKNKSM